MLCAALNCRDDVRLYRLQSLDYHVLYSVHYGCEVDADFLEVDLELGQVPFRGVFVVFAPSSRRLIRTLVLYIVLVLFVDRVISQMNVPLISRFLAIRVFLSCEAHKPFLKEVYF